MVQSTLPTVDAWIDTVEPHRRPALAQLRALCRERLSGWEERMRWGMPGYGPAGEEPVVSFNSQKQYIALYVGGNAVSAFADRLARLNCGKGCIRYRRPEQIDFAVVSDMLDAIRARGGPMC